MKRQSNKSFVWLLVPIAVFAGLWIFANRNPQLHEGVDKEKGGFEMIRAVDADSWLENEKVFVLDVHTPEQTHLTGTDAFIPYDQLEQNKGRLPADKSTPILVYCRSGSMSRIASEQLVEMGYEKVLDLVGGVQAYRETHNEVKITPEQMDLGKVDYLEGAELEFTLTNNTANELEVTRLTGSCSCTKPSMEKMTVSPYSSEVIKVKFEPSVHEDDSDLGELTRQIFVETDNPNFADLSVKFTATVEK